MAMSTRLCYAEVSQDRYKRPTSQRCCVNFKGVERAAGASWQGSESNLRARKFPIEGEHLRRTFVGGELRDHALATASPDRQADAVRRR
jgi:hypothetical protein